MKKLERQLEIARIARKVKDERVKARAQYYARKRRELGL